jgi:hypothetical protein
LNPRMAAGLLLFAGLLALIAMRVGAPVGASASGVFDQRYTPPTVTAVSSAKTCPDGTVELLASVCPAPVQACGGNEVIYATQVCPSVSAALAMAPSGPATAGGSGSGPPADGSANPTVTVCGTASSFNPTTQMGELAPSATVAVGQLVLCGSNFTAGPGCQPAGESVDFGDGSQAVVNAQLQGASHSYSQTGVYSVTDTISSCPAPVSASVTVTAGAGATGPQTAPQPYLAGSTAASCTSPATPENVTVTAQPDLFHALIAWTDSGADASSFQIASGNGSLVATAGSAVTQFSASSWYDNTTGGMIQVAPTGWWDLFSVTAVNSCGASPAAWGQVRMPCPDGADGDAHGDATNSCSRMAAANPG